MADLVIAPTSAFVSEWEMVEQGRLYFADDPVVLANPGLFDTHLERYAVRYHERTASAVESFEPVKRGPGRPRKDTNV